MLQSQWSPVEFNILNELKTFSFLQYLCRRSYYPLREMLHLWIALRQLPMLTYFLLMGGQVSVCASGVQSGFPCTRSSQGLLEKLLCLRDILHLDSSVFVWRQVPWIWPCACLPSSQPGPREKKIVYLFICILGSFHRGNTINLEVQILCQGMVANLRDFKDFKWMTIAHLKLSGLTEAPFSMESRVIMS